MLLAAGVWLGVGPSRAAACVGDCDGSGTVTVDELITMVDVVLGLVPLSRCVAGDADGGGTITVDEVIVAVNNSLGACPLPTTTPSSTPSATPSATPSSTPPVTTPTPTVAALGTRHFVLNPASSTFTVGLSPSQSLSLGSFQGQKNGMVGQPAYLDLRAGPPDSHGLAVIDVVDASDYLYVDATAQAQIVVCIKPLVPSANAGLVACNGGPDFSLGITQNHHLGQIGIDGFTAAQCASHEGSIESASAPHPGVCNGPYAVSQLGGDSGPGAVSISSVPQLGLQGLPVEISFQPALPCAGPGAPALFVFTSAASRSTILNFNNMTGICSAGTTGHSCSTDADCDTAVGAGDGVCGGGATFQSDSHGENFSCADWQAANAPGCLVSSAPQLDSPLTNTDLVTVFTFCGR